MLLGKAHRCWCLSLFYRMLIAWTSVSCLSISAIGLTIPTLLLPFLWERQLSLVRFASWQVQVHGHAQSLILPQAWKTLLSGLTRGTCKFWSLSLHLPLSPFCQICLLDSNSTTGLSSDIEIPPTSSAPMSAVFILLIPNLTSDLVLSHLWLHSSLEVANHLHHTRCYNALFHLIRQFKNAYYVPTPSARSCGHRNLEHRALLLREVHCVSGN